MASKHAVENFVEKEKEIVPYLIMLFLLYYISIEGYKIFTGKQLLESESSVALGIGLVVISFMAITMFIISKKYPVEYKNYLRAIKKNYDLKSFKRFVISLLGVSLFFAVIAFASWDIRFILLVLEGLLICLLGLYFVKSIEKISEE